MPKINLTLDTHNNQVVMNGASRIDVPAETIQALTTAVERQAIAESATAGHKPQPNSTSQAIIPSLLNKGTTVVSNAPPSGISEGTHIHAGGQLSAVHADIAKYLTNEQ